MKTIPTVCLRDCPDTCFLDAIVDQGKLVKTRGSRLNPLTRGVLCPRGIGDPQRVYSPDRLLSPHRRTSAGLSPVSWDEALDTLADRIRTTIDIHGRQSVLLYDYPGNTGLLAWHFPKRLWAALGATTTDYALCSRSGHTGIGMHYGLSYGLPLTAVEAAAVILFWGHNAKVSAGHIWSLARRARKKRGTVIVSVDPRQSPTAKAADIWIRPRPGSDVALCYGIARYLITHGGIDRDFIKAHTTGFDAYANATDRWTAQRVERVSGMSHQVIAQIGDLLMANRPAAFMIGLGLQKSRQGAEAARAVALLPALLGQHRGYHYSNGSAHTIDWATINGSRLTNHRSKVVSQVAVGKRLAAGEFKLVYVMGSNPAVTLPHQTAVRRGLARADVFVAVHDTHWSDTAVRADLVLPAPTFLEKRDVSIADHHTYCRLAEKGIDPLGDSRHEIWVMRELARRLGLDHAWLAEAPWPALEKPLDNTFQKGGLKDILAGDILEVQSLPTDVYQTPSGKIDFWATTPPDGASPLPAQQPLRLDPNRLVLLNSATPKYTHSQFTDVYGPIPQVVWIHPRDARRWNITDRQPVVLFNALAEVTVVAEVTDKVLSGTVWVPRPLTGLNGVPLNALIPGESQPIGNGPMFNSVEVAIRPADSATKTGIGISTHDGDGDDQEG